MRPSPPIWRNARLCFFLSSLFLPPACALADDPAYWLDQQSRLVWATSDNGSGVSLSQANRFCQESRVGGFNDWVLPTIGELQSLFDPKVSRDGRHVKGPTKLSGWEWSSTPGLQPGEGWVIDFGDGARASVAAGDSGLNRALCVRRPEGTQKRSGH